ncbi:MAG: lysophospholipid acyltransferase family protein [Eubacteriales bacterium]|nr:lysophospholipid acyltransferase family protein [Eubacteriales bacterium]
MIFWIFVAESLAAAVLLGVFVPTAAWAWWQTALLALGGFVGAFLALNVLFLLLLFVISLFFPKGEPKKESRFWRRWTVHAVRWIFDMLRVRVKVEGRELLPGEPVVLVSNHRSDFDPMAAMVAFSHRPLVYISKESNLRIPIAGAFVRRCHFLPIDRENPRSALATLKHAASLMREEGLDIGIYPEGTRSYKGGPKPFKEGAFLMAKQAGAPIVLMTTEGTEEIAGHVILRRNIVRLRLLRVISAEEVAATTARELTRLSEETLLAALGQTTERPTT